MLLWWFGGDGGHIGWCDQVAQFKTTTAEAIIRGVNTDDDRRDKEYADDERLHHEIAAAIAKICPFGFGNDQFIKHYLILLNAGAHAF